MAGYIDLQTTSATVMAVSPPDASGNVMVVVNGGNAAGVTFFGNYYNADASGASYIYGLYLFKISPTGTVLWHCQVRCGGSSLFLASNIAVDSSGNFYLCAGTGAPNLTTVYDATGTSQYAATVNTVLLQVTSAGAIGWGIQNSAAGSYTSLATNGTNLAITTVASGAGSWVLGASTLSMTGGGFTYMVLGLLACSTGAVTYQIQSTASVNSSVAQIAGANCAMDVSGNVHLVFGYASGTGTVSMGGSSVSKPSGVPGVYHFKINTSGTATAAHVANSAGTLTAPIRIGWYGTTFVLGWTFSGTGTFTFNGKSVTTTNTIQTGFYITDATTFTTSAAFTTPVPSVSPSNLTTAAVGMTASGDVIVTGVMSSSTVVTFGPTTLTAQSASGTDVWVARYSPGSSAWVSAGSVGTNKATYTTQQAPSAGASFDSLGNTYLCWSVPTATLSPTPVFTPAYSPTQGYALGYVATVAAFQDGWGGVSSAPAITSSSSIAFVQGVSGSFTNTATGYPAPTWTITSGTLPTGLTLNATTGVISGTPSGSLGTYSITLKATNTVGFATQAVTLTVNAAPSITSASSASGVQGTAFSFTATATGYPAPTWSVIGTLPAGLSLNSTTGAITGTPSVNGVFSFTLVATGYGSPASQPFTLTINAAPVFTSSAGAVFTYGSASSFNVTATGTPAPTFAVTSGSLPTGITLTSGGLLSGTPTVTGLFSFVITATGYGTPATQTFNLLCVQPPTITNASSTTFVDGSPGSFAFTATGYPTSSWSITSGSLPSGVTLSSSGLLSGTPTVSGSFPFTVQATNGFGTNPTQNFTLTVTSAAPTFTSSTSATFVNGTAGSFAVTATGAPAPTYSITSGSLPTGLSLNTTTGLITGTPSVTGTFVLGLNATNGVAPDATQTLTLIVVQAPAITSANNTTFVEYVSNTFSVTTTGYPAPTVSLQSGSLPSGVSLSSAGVLSGTPTQSGVFTFTAKASNGVSPDATQAFTLTVNAAPAITNANTYTGNKGVAMTFTFTATGYPAPTWSVLSGTLPAGITLNSTTGVLSGTTTADGVYVFVVSAHNSTSPDATQSFTLNIDAPPAITSANNTTFTEGVAGSFSVTTTGTPTPTTTVTSGSLPGGVTLSTAGLLSGTPAVNGVFSFVITAHNGVSPDDTQNFTLTIDQAPTITSANNTTFNQLEADSFQMTASGYPASTWTILTGTLPAGVTLSSGGLLSGSAATAGTYPIEVQASNGISPAATQNFTLYVIGASPVFTSATSTSFTEFSFNTFAVTATGTPAPTFALVSGTLPAGVTLSSGGTLSGVPTQTGVFPVVFSATNIIGSVNQSFSLVVNAAPTFTNSANESIPEDVYSSFQFTCSGYPTTFTFALVSGTLPTGMALSSSGVLDGTPTQNGTFPILVSSTNGVSPDASQHFTINIYGTAPLFTSGASTVFRKGAASSYSVTASGVPDPTFTKTSGSLPSGVTLATDGTLSGTATTTGTYVFQITAANGVSPDAHQTFTLMITDQPAITSANHCTFTEGTAGSFTVTATGYPAPTFSVVSGTLPTGLSLSSGGVLSGTATEYGIYVVTVQADNSIGTPAQQVLTITVDASPTITSPATTSFVTGQANSFEITSTGFPAPESSFVTTYTGSLPTGVTFHDNGDGTATLSGDPTPGQTGNWPALITVTDGVSPAYQNFELVVLSPVPPDIQRTLPAQGPFVMPDVYISTTMNVTVGVDVSAQLTGSNIPENITASLVAADGTSVVLYVPVTSYSSFVVQNIDGSYLTALTKYYLDFTWTDGSSTDEIYSLRLNVKVPW